MATVPIGIKVDEKVKDRIEELVELGRYTNVSDFVHHAIASELERGGRSNEEYVREMADRIVNEGFLTGRYNEQVDAAVRTVLGQVVAQANLHRGDEPSS